MQILSPRTAHARLIKVSLLQDLTHFGDDIHRPVLATVSVEERINQMHRLFKHCFVLLDLTACRWTIVYIAQMNPLIQPGGGH
jgi:hypothetical protein